jgi:hypothetical protein
MLSPSRGAVGLLAIDVQVRRRAAVRDHLHAGQHGRYLQRGLFGDREARDGAAADAVDQVCDLVVGELGGLAP